MTDIRSKNMICVHDRNGRGFGLDLMDSSIVDAAERLAHLSQLALDTLAKAAGSLVQMAQGERDALSRKSHAKLDWCASNPGGTDAEYEKAANEIDLAAMPV